MQHGGERMLPAFLRRRTQAYGLSHRQLADASDRAVDSCVVLVRTNDRLQHRSFCHALLPNWKMGSTPLACASKVVASFSVMGWKR